MTNQTKTTPKEKTDPRSKQIAERKALMRKLNPPIERVRVTPADDDMRRVLKHPNGFKFPPTGSVEWPLDQFTRRRIKDGSVSIEKRAKPEQKPEAKPPEAKPEEGARRDAPPPPATEPAA